MLCFIGEVVAVALLLIENLLRGAHTKCRGQGGSVEGGVRNIPIFIRGMLVGMHTMHPAKWWQAPFMRLL